MMKKLLFWVTVIVCFGSSATAQNAIGHQTVVLGGTMGLNYVTSDVPLSGSLAGNTLQSGATTITSNILASFYINNKVAIGINFGFNNREDRSVVSSINYGYVSITNTQTFAIGPLVRYTEMLTGKFGIFGQGTFLYQNTGVNYSVGDKIGTVSVIQPNKVTYNGISINLNPGLVYFVAPHWGLEANLGVIQFISQTNTSNTPATTTNTFNANIGLNSLAFGVQYYFGSVRE